MKTLSELKLLAQGGQADIYIIDENKVIRVLRNADEGDFSKWMIVRASERVFYGMPSEKEELINYIKTCKNAYEQGIDPSKWWKYI